MDKQFFSFGFFTLVLALLICANFSTAQDQLPKTPPPKNQKAQPSQYAQRPTAQPVAPASGVVIQFDVPKTFVCGKTIQWSDLNEENWPGKDNTSICGHEPYYTAKGHIVTAPMAYKISMEIYVPEAGKAWPVSGGKFRDIEPPDLSFSGNFCIPKKGPQREFWFQVYGNDKKEIGKKCVIKVAESW